MKKLLSILLVFSLLLVCASPIALASELTAEQEQMEEEAPELQRIWCDTPPYGTANNYNNLISTTNGSIFFDSALQALSAYLVNVALIASGAPGLGPDVDYGLMLKAIIDGLLNKPESNYDQYAGNTSLYYTEYRYQGQWADAVKVERRYYFDSARIHYVGRFVYYYLYI